MAKYKKGKDGYYKTKVWDGTYTEDGAKHRVNLRTDKSSAELERMVNEFNRQIEERQFVRKTAHTFYEYAVQWNKAYKADTRGNTQAMYDNIVDKHLVKVQCGISNVTKSHYMALMAETKGVRTKQQIRMTFKQIVKSAIDDKLLPATAYDEIFENTPKIKYKSKEKRPLTEYEKKAVFDACYVYPMDKAFVYILYGCGLRREEAIALTKFDVNLKKKEINVNKVITFPKGQTLLEDTTKNGIERKVPIPDKIFPFIEEYVHSHGCLNLFHSQKSVLPSLSFYRRMWDRIIVAMQNASKNDKIEGLTAHIFRHNYCTMLCYKIPEISIGEIANLLGDSEEMVIKVYNHILKEKQKTKDVVNNAINF